MLKELAEGGFIDPDPGLNPETGEEARVSRYRLRDNYTRFYLKYIEPRKGMIMRGSYRFASLSSLPDWNAVMGLQFENLIVNNAMELVPYLGMGNSTVESAAVQTPRAAYVVEIKRRNEIGAEIEKEVAERMKRLPLRRGMSKRPVLVCDGHVDPAVEADGFFSAIIQGRRLLGI